MPTGYTAKIADGIDFKTFAMDCARAMGVCITLRDDPMGGERIPAEFTPDSYHRDAGKVAADELRKVVAMSASECTRAAMDAYESAERSRLDSMRNDADLKAKYDAMLAQVLAWQPPTPGHERYKAFMVEQIEDSIRLDCGYERPATVKMSGGEWRAAQIERLESSVTYHAKHFADEVARSEERTTWVKSLRESLERV